MKILFVSEEIFERPVKFSELLRIKGLEVTLITSDKNFQKYRNYFNNIIILHAQDLLNFIKKDKPNVIHHFSKAIDHYTIELINSKIKFIYDYKDIFPNIHTLPVPKWHLEALSLMLRRNNPIIYRDTQYEGFLKRGGFSPSSIGCFIPDFIWYSNYGLIKKNHPVLDEQKNSLVFIGNFTLETIEPQYRGLGQIDIVKNIINQKIHYSIYPFRHDNADENYRIMGEYIEMANSSIYFHLNERVEFKILHQELIKYGWGVNFWPHSHFDEVKDLHHLVLPYYGNSARFSDYLGAGLPLIVSEDFIEAADWIRSYGIGIVLKRNDLLNIGEIINNSDYLEIRSKVVKFNEDSLNPNKWFEIILKFYESIAD